MGDKFKIKMTVTEVTLPRWEGKDTLQEGESVPLSLHRLAFLHTMMGFISSKSRVL